MDDSRVATLSDVLGYLQSEVVQINPTPNNRQHPVSDVLLFDPLDSSASWTNRIVLAPGVSPSAAEFHNLLERSETSDAAAVVMKAHGTVLSEIRSALGRYSCALLIVEDDADWTRLGGLIRASALGAATDTVSGVRLGDVYALANAVASATNGATSIVDPVGRILGYSTLPGQPIDDLRRATTLTLQELVSPIDDPDFAVVYRSGEAVRIAGADGELDRFAIAVRAAGELLATIWTIDPGNGRADQVADTLNRMAPLAGLHLLHARAGADFGERRSSDLMRTLLEDPAHAPFAAAQLGLDPSEGISVAVFSLDRPDRGSLDATRDLQRLLHLATMTCDLHFRVRSCALIDSRVYALFPAHGNDPRETHRRIAAEITMYSRSRAAEQVLAAVGGIARSIGELPRSRTEAVQTLAHLASLAISQHSESVALVEDFRARLGLNAVGAYLHDAGLDNDPDVLRIRDYDRSQGTDYLTTLREYLSANGNMSAVAAGLNIHNNTARYRITRLREDFDLQLDDPDTFLWLRLQLAAASW